MCLVTADDDSYGRAAQLLADAWGPALAAAQCLGYERGYARGHADAESAMAISWAELVRQVRDGARCPSAKDLERRRQPDHEPCGRRCGRCSRCIHSLSYWQRGGRDFLGTAAERALLADKHRRGQAA